MLGVVGIGHLCMEGDAFHSSLEGLCVLCMQGKLSDMRQRVMLGRHVAGEEELGRTATQELCAFWTMINLHVHVEYLLRGIVVWSASP